MSEHICSMPWWQYDKLTVVAAEWLIAKDECEACVRELSRAVRVNRLEAAMDYDNTTDRELPAREHRRLAMLRR